MQVGAEAGVSRRGPEIAIGWAEAPGPGPLFSVSLASPSSLEGRGLNYFLKSNSYCSVLIISTTHSSRVSNLTSLKLLEGKDCVGIAELWIRGVFFLGGGRVWTRYHSLNFFKLKTWHSNTDLECVFNPLITKPIQRSSEEQKLI